MKMNELDKNLRHIIDLQNALNLCGIAMSKKELAEKAYRKMESLGADVCILNEKYLIVDGTKVEFVKSRKYNGWLVKIW